MTTDPGFAMSWRASRAIGSTRPRRRGNGWTMPRKRKDDARFLGQSAEIDAHDFRGHHLAFTQRAVDTLKPLARGFVEYWTPRRRAWPCASSLPARRPSTSTTACRTSAGRRGGSWGASRASPSGARESRRAQVLLCDGVAPIRSMPRDAEVGATPCHDRAVQP
jgi:hypothetical protein